MAGGAEGRPISLDQRMKLLDGAQPHRDEDRQAHGADGRISVGARRRHAQSRAQVEQRSWHDGNVAELVESSRVGEAFMVPGALQDLEHLCETFAAFAVRHTVSLVRARNTAAADRSGAKCNSASQTASKPQRSAASAWAKD